MAVRHGIIVVAVLAVTTGGGSAENSLRRRQQAADTQAPLFNCVATDVSISSSTLELPLPSLFADLKDDDVASEASITVTVSNTGGALLGSTSVAPNAGAASAVPSWDACSSSDGMDGIRLTDSGVIGRGDSPVLSTVGDYQNNIDCYWRLSCSNPAATPALTFTTFDTQAAADVVDIRDGAAVTGPADARSGDGGFDHEYEWESHEGHYLGGYTADGIGWLGTRQEAEAACIALGDGCGGILHDCGTQCGDESQGRWQTRANSAPSLNPSAVIGTAARYEDCWVKGTSPNLRSTSSATVSTTALEMTVHFHTDASETSSGFQASFMCVGAAPVADSRAARTRYNDAAPSLSFATFERYDGVDCTSKGAADASGSLDGAMAACSADPTCAGLADRGCDGAGFVTCLSGSAYEPVPSAQRIRSCVYERPAFTAATIGPLTGVAVLQSTAVQVAVSDRAGNTDTCSAVINVIAPQLVLSQASITASALITTVERVAVTLTNGGTDDLVLRTGSPGGMALSDGAGNSIGWAVAEMTSEGGDVQVAGTNDLQIFLLPQESLELFIEMRGTSVPTAATYTGQLAIASNDPVTPLQLLPLSFTVDDYGLIMLALPETVEASSTPRAKTEHSVTVYNVLSVSLPWQKEGCTCAAGSVAQAVIDACVTIGAADTSNPGTAGADCTADATCTFDATASTCAPTDTQYPCQLAHSEVLEACNVPTCTFTPGDASSCTGTTGCAYTADDANTANTDEEACAAPTCTFTAGDASSCTGTAGCVYVTPVTGSADEILVELNSCSGTMAVAGSHRVLLRLRAPETAGSYSKSWKLTPTSGSSQSFLRANVNMLVTAALADFQPSRTAVARLSAIATGPVRASQDFRLVCTMYDQYGNEIKNDGLDGWSMLLTTAASVNVSVPIVFDFSLPRADGGRPGLYATATIPAERQGVYTVAEVVSLDGTHTVTAQRFDLTVEPLQCDPPRIIPSVDGASCLVQWCDAGSEPSVDRSLCTPCGRGRYSVLGAECITCANGTAAAQMGSFECLGCTAGEVSNVDNTGCVSCDPGKEPNIYQGNCNNCTSGHYRAFNGGQCQACAAPNVVDAVQSACDTCPAGRTTSSDRVSCEACPVGTVRSNGVRCEACETGTVANLEQSECVACELGSVPSNDRMACVCESGYYDVELLPKVDCYETDFFATQDPYSNAANCSKCPSCMVCETSTPTLREGYEFASWPITITDLSTDGLGTNEELLGLRVPAITNEDDLGPRTRYSAVQHRHYAFKCPVPDACTGNTLAVVGNGYNDSCVEGHKGRLCFNCEDGWRKGPKGACSKCEYEGSSPLFLIPCGFLFLYVAFRWVLSRRREKRLDRIAQSEQLFEEMDLDGSGAVNRTELLTALHVLGHESATEDTAMRIMDLIDLDRSGGIDKHEFVAWMEHNVSQVKMGMVVAKILFGLTQILSRQPETMKEDFPGAHWEEFKFFSFDFSWTMPVCGVDYWTRWFSNAILLPLLLLGLVWFSWLTEACSNKEAEETRDGPTVAEAAQGARLTVAFRGTVDKEGLGAAATRHLIADDEDVELTRPEIKNMFEKLGNKLTDEELAGIFQQMDADGDGKIQLSELEEWLGLDKKNAGVYDERKASKASDYYFAFFLCYPTMTQTFFQHFNCRTLSDERTVLEADYSIECGTASTEDGLLWVAVAVLSFLGIALVSVGVPVYMWARMRKVWKVQMQKANMLKVSRVVAYRDFHRRFGYMSGDFKPEAYYAECVDLFRKLAMTGVLVLLAPGTIIQSFCSVLLAVFFLAVQIKLWPYPHLGANMLKAFTDLQIFLVTLVGLVLRINPDDLQKDPLSKGFILCVLEGRPCGNAGGDVEDVEQTAAASLYGDVLLTLLILTLIPVALSIFFHSDVQNAQHFLLQAGQVIVQPQKKDKAGKPQKKCCGNKKQENLLKRRAELRKQATVTSLHIEEIDDLFELTNVEQAEVKLAVKKACRRAVPGCTITKVELFAGSNGIIAKVYFETSEHKNKIETALESGIEIRYEDDGSSTYAPYKAWPVDPDSTEKRTDRLAEYELGETLRESVASLKAGQGQWLGNMSAAAANRDDLYAARRKRQQDETDLIIDEMAAIMEAPADDTHEADDGGRRQTADEPLPEMPEARHSVLPDEAHPPDRRFTEGAAEPALTPTPRKELIEIYTRFNPRKVGDVDKLISEWSLKPGGIPKLLAKVRGKYLLDDPEAAAQKPKPKAEAVSQKPPAQKPKPELQPELSAGGGSSSKRDTEEEEDERARQESLASLQQQHGGGEGEEPKKVANVEKDDEPPPPGMPDARDSVMPASVVEPVPQGEAPRRTKKDGSTSVKHVF